MANNDFANATQFDYLYNALANKYPGLTGDNKDTFFQFSTVPQAATWMTGNDAAAYDAANVVPETLDGFYTPGDALDTAYGSLLISIKPKEGSDNPDYLALQKKVGDLTNQQTGLVQQATDAYYTWVGNNPGPNGTAAETKTEWLQDPLGGQSWNNKIVNLQGQIDELSGEVAAQLVAMDAALSQAIKNLTLDMMPLSHGGKAINVPTVTIDGDLAGDKTRWDGYPAGQFDFDVTIDRNSTITTPWKTVYTTTVKQQCWRTDVETSVNTSRLISDSNYKLRFSAVGAEGYKITRGKWFDPNFIDPNVQITQGAQVNNDTFFGVQGSLHMIPEVIFVLYKPTIKLTISTQVYKQQFEANADAGVNWIEIMGFHFNFSGLASLQPIDDGSGTTTVTFASPDDAVPQVIGVISRAAYNGHGDTN